MPPKGSQAVTKKPRSGTKAAAAAAGTRSTTPFLDALMVVPDLALTCSSILDSDRHALGPGSGLKRLRLLSQGFKAAIHKAVHGFKLELNFKEPVASAIDYPRMLAFLKGVQLLRLRIIVLPLGRGKGMLLCKAMIRANHPVLDDSYQSYHHVSVLMIMSVRRLW